MKSGRISEYDKRSLEEVENKEESEVQYGMLTTVMETSLSASNGFSKDLWIADSGAPQHMTNSDLHMYDKKSSPKKITVGNIMSSSVGCVGNLDLEVTKI